LKVETRLDFADRVLAVGPDGAATRSVRRVEKAAAAINGEVRPTSSALRPEVALLVAEMASALKDRGATIWSYLDELYAQYGCYRNLQHLVELPGKTGMQVMREVMLGLRGSPPATLGGRHVVSVIDRLPAAKSAREAYAIGSGDDMITFVLSDDQRNRVTARPSGTEPKLKYYVQLYQPVPAAGDVGSVRESLSQAALEVAQAIVKLSGSALDGELQKEWNAGVRRLV